MTIDSGAFIKPAFRLCRVDPHHQNIVGAIVEIIGQIEAKAVVAAFVASQPATVEPDLRIAKHAVELNDDAASGIARRNGKHPTIPANAGAGKGAAERFEALIFSRVRIEGQSHRPIVWKGDRLPARIVKLKRTHPRRRGGLGRVRAIAITAHLLQIVAGAETEVFRRIGRIAEVEFPTGIKKEPFPPASRALPMGRGGNAEYKQWPKAAKREVFHDQGRDKSRLIIRPRFRPGGGKFPKAVNSIMSLARNTSYWIHRLE